MRFVQGRHRADLDDDEMLRLALTKLVEIVGEAAKRISDTAQAELPEVPWSAAARAWAPRDHRSGDTLTVQGHLAEVARVVSA